MGEADELRKLTDAELLAIAAEAEGRDMPARTLQLVNDELRRRRLPAAAPRRRWE